MDNFFYGSFNLAFQDGSDIEYLAVYLEMAPTKVGTKPLGSYFINCIHPVHGLCTSIVEQDDACRWFSERHPLFISPAFIEWIGE